MQITENCDDGSVEIIWAQALTEEVIDAGWLEGQTKIFVIDLNFFNLLTGIVMDTKIIMTKKDEGLLVLSLDTNRACS